MNAPRSTPPAPAPSDALILYERLLRPHRALGPRGVAWVLGALAGLCGVGCAVLVAVGAWPAAWFLGGEWLLVAGALWWSRRPTRRSERIILTDREVRITVCDGRGRQRSKSLVPHWLTIQLDHPPGGSPRLLLTSHGRSTRIGAFLDTRTLVDLHDDLSREIARLRASPACGQTPMPGARQHAR